MRPPLDGTLLVTQLFSSLRGGPGEAYNACHGQTCERCLAHAGIDINCPEGTPVRAMKAGRVQFFGPPWGFPDGGYGPLGLYAVVTLPDGEQYWYAHLSHAEVAPATALQEGQVFALSGASGNVSGAHLHVGWRPAKVNYLNHFDGFEDFITHFDGDVRFDFSLV